LLRIRTEKLWRLPVPKIQQVSLQGLNEPLKRKKKRKVMITLLSTTKAVLKIFPRPALHAFVINYSGPQKS